MEELEFLNLVIIALQTLIIFMQFCLSKKINDQGFSKDKGYFIIEKTNYRTVEEYQYKFTDQFQLSDETFIDFELVGDSDVILHSSNIEINGVHQSCDQIPRETYFSRASRFNKLTQKFNFSEQQLREKKIDVVLSYKLENVAGYKYCETIIMQFEKEKDEEKFWDLKKYNMTFSKR